MIPEIGHFSLWLALGIALVMGAVPLAGAQSGRADWMALARPLAYALFFCVALAFGCLVSAFVNHELQHRFALAVPHRRCVGRA